MTFVTVQEVPFCALRLNINETRILKPVTKGYSDHVTLSVSPGSRLMWVGLPVTG